MTMTRTHSHCSGKLAATGLLLVSVLSARAQEKVDTFNVTAHATATTSSKQSRKQAGVPRPAALWLVPVHESRPLGSREAKIFTLLQKNKQFSPHLLIVPVGSMVHFPNADPFFHNVFSLFNGRRFDLGLYEAGSSREVMFGREGVSYIFCNIHPEMSAVVIALSTPFYAIEDAQGGFHISNVPADDYMLHVWEEGADPASSATAPRRVHVSSGHTDLGTIPLPQIPLPTVHDNKYGQKYDTHEHSIY
jgi:plastocyanin